jgi:hypothetical protein
MKDQGDFCDRKTIGIPWGLAGSSIGREYGIILANVSIAFCAEADRSAGASYR